jgi:ATP-dependent protease ClpP protease subunit
MKIQTEKFWKLTAQEKGDGPENVDLLIFSNIGDPWSDESTWSRQFAEDLWQLPESVNRLNLHINSPGGSVPEAQAIYSSLADHKSEKIVFIDGIAASAASLIAMVGHKTYIRSNANMMIHLPMAQAVGNVDVMRDAIGMLESVTEPMITVYEKKTKLPRDRIRALLEAETWFTPEQAVKEGFADEVRGVIKAAASLGHGRVIFNGRTFNLAPFEYRNTPSFPEATDQTMQKTKSTPPAAQTAPETKPAKEQPKTPPPLEPEETAEEREEREREEREEREREAREARNAMAEFEAHNPSLARAFHERGVAAERARLEALDKFTHPACAQIVSDARASGKTAEQISLACYQAVAQADQQRDRRDDAKILGLIRSGDAPFAPPGPGSKTASGANVVRTNATAELIKAGKKNHNRH